MTDKSTQLLMQALVTTVTFSYYDGNQGSGRPGGVVTMLYCRILA